MSDEKKQTESIEDIQRRIDAQDEQDRIEVGRNISRYRREKDLSQDDFSQQVDHDANGNTISRIENGRSNFRIDMLFSMAEVLSVTPNELCPRRFIKGTPLEFYGNLTERDRRVVGDVILSLISNKITH